MTFSQTNHPFSNSFGTLPRPLLLLIGITSGVSLAAGLFDRFFTGYLGILSPHQLFGLSWTGINSLYVWQPLTYLFFHHGMGGLSLGFLIELFFHMYMLYIMGNSICSHLGTRAFLGVYFASGLAAGLAALATSQLLGHSFLLLGAGPAIFGILALWAMLYPGLELMLFFSIRCTARILFLVFVGLSLLISLSQGNLVGMATHLVGALTGYLIGVIVWDLRGPFAQTHAIDAAISTLGSGMRRRQQQTQEMFKTVYHKAKVFDFETGEAILDDEAFMDAMLTKISRYGEKTLSRSERKRMQQISRNQKGS